jgi:hypothetical protein
MMVQFGSVWIINGPNIYREYGHQETEGVPLEGRCGNTLPRRMLLKRLISEVHL